jgi:hypothetical protein
VVGKGELKPRAFDDPRFKTTCSVCEADTRTTRVVENARVEGAQVYLHCDGCGRSKRTWWRVTDGEWCRTS